MVSVVMVTVQHRLLLRRFFLPPLRESTDPRLRRHRLAALSHVASARLVGGAVHVHHFVLVAVFVFVVLEDALDLLPDLLQARLHLHVPAPLADELIKTVLSFGLGGVELDAGQL